MVEPATTSVAQKDEVRPGSPEAPELTVIMVSYNTRELTLIALETLFENCGDVSMEVVLWDNASVDGSADAVAERFPHQVKLVRCKENLGFAAANNAAAAEARTPWLLLLNPDTETHPRAIENLLNFARANPQAGIVGGRTVFPDGSLNPSSCWAEMTLWSRFCAAFGLTALFPGSSLFNPEGMGGWKRDSVRHVAIVSGCFFMLPTALWRELGGFRSKYWMYGEEADLCLRARALGYRPMITPQAQIMHLVGASSAKAADKLLKVQRAKISLMKDHWPRWKVPLGMALAWLWAAHRLVAVSLLALAGIRNSSTQTWTTVWRERRTWLSGYESGPRDTPAKV